MVILHFGRLGGSNFMRIIKFSLREISSTSFTPYLTEYRKHESDMENVSYDGVKMYTEVNFIKLNCPLVPVLIVDIFQWS